MNLNNIVNTFKHIKRIIIHKHWVLYYANKCGITWQGITHDLSKFSPIEFFESIKYFVEGKSPIEVAKDINGYSLAWQHHKGHNPHHYEYWVDNLDKGGTAIKMPYKYVIEFICDYLAAGKTYNGKDFTFEKEYNWFCRKILLSPPKMHPKTLVYLCAVFETIAKENRVDRILLDKVKKEIEYDV